MSLKARDVDQMWRKFGYEIDDSGNHVRAVLTVDGKIVAKTMRSHGKTKLDGRIPDEIRKQMRLNHPQFREAVQCPLGRAEYYEILREQGLLP